MLRQDLRRAEISARQIKATVATIREDFDAKMEERSF